MRAKGSPVLVMPAGGPMVPPLMNPRDRLIDRPPWKQLTELGTLANPCLLQREVDKDRRASLKAWIVDRLTAHRTL